MARKTVNITLALGWNERFDHRIAVGIIKYAREHDDLRLFGNDWLFQTPGGGPPRPDGIIARITSRDDLTRLQSFLVPIVDIANAYADTSMPRAVNDDALTGRLGGTHLLDRGYPHLAFVGVDGAEWSARRYAGVGEVLRDRDLPANPPLYEMGSPWLKRGHNLTGLVRWLKKLPLPCGVMAANDLVGYRVTLAAALAGLRVPDELGVIGVDNEDVYCELSQPALTSISSDCERIGREATHLLCQILNGEDPLRQVVIPPLAVAMRDSTDLVLSENKLIRDVRQFIRVNVGRGINVADVAASFPLSRRALEKRFKQETGNTLHEELMEIRLQRARDLLASGSNVAEAGYESGFRAIPHFYHAFKTRFKLTPLEYASGAVQE